MNEKIPAYHIGPDGCGQIAFYFTKRMIDTDKVNTHLIMYVITIESQRSALGEFVRCDSCARLVGLNPKELEQR